MPINPMTLPPTDEVFSWSDPDTGQSTHFAITKLNAFLAVSSIKPQWVAIPDNFAEWLLTNRGVNKERAAALTFKEMADPVTMVDMGGHYLLADGTHRVYRRAIEGHKTALGRLVPRAIWYPFTLLGPNMTPEQILAAPDRKRQ